MQNNIDLHPISRGEQLDDLIEQRRKKAQKQQALQPKPADTLDAVIEQRRQALRASATTGQMAKPQKPSLWEQLKSFKSPAEQYRQMDKKPSMRESILQGGLYGIEQGAALPLEEAVEVSQKLSGLYATPAEHGEIPAARALRRIFYKGDKPAPAWYTMDKFVMDDMNVKGKAGFALSMILGIALDWTTYASVGLGAISETGKLSRLQRLAQVGKVVVDPMAVGITGGMALEPKIMTVGGKVATKEGAKAFVEISKDVATEVAERGLNVADKAVAQQISQEAIKRWNLLQDVTGKTAEYTTPTLTLGVPFTKAGKTFGGTKYIPTAPTGIPEPTVDWQKAGRQIDAERTLNEILGPAQAEQYLAELNAKGIEVELSPLLVPEVHKEITRNNTISKINTDFANKS